MLNALIKKPKDKRGFTLMEVLVVVAIIAIIAVISVTGILRIRENLAFRQKNDYAKTIFMAAQTHLTELRAANGLAQLQEVSNDANINNDAQLEDDPDTVKVEYDGYKFTASGDNAYSAAYNIILPVGSVDSTVRDQQVIIEYNPKTGNVYSVFYSEEAAPLINQYQAGSLPRNAEGDEERRKDMMLGYYDGSDLSSEELGVMKVEADIVFENGEEGLVTVIVPTQDDSHFSIAEDGNYNRYMTGLTVKLTIVGEMGGVIEKDIKSAGTFNSDTCYVSTDDGGANVIHITYPIDSLVNGGSFAELSSGLPFMSEITGETSNTNENVFQILPGDNVSITAEVTYESSPTDPIVEIEDAMVTGVNPMFHSLTPGSAEDKYILTVSNGRNLQNLNALAPSIAEKVETVLFVQDNGETENIIDWNDTVEYYNETYGVSREVGDPKLYENDSKEAPARALPYFVPVMNDKILGETDVKIMGNGVKIYGLNIDASKYAVPANTYYAANDVSYSNTGLFATAKTSIEGISIVNPVIRGLAYEASPEGSETPAPVPSTGALVGLMDPNASVTNCGVYIDTEDIDFVRSNLNMKDFKGDEEQYGVSGHGAVGGLIGYSQTNKTVEASFAAVPVYGVHTSTNGGAGGLVGVSRSTIYKKCYASGTVFSNKSDTSFGSGGFVGTSSGGQYTNCFASGDVTTSTASTIGCAGFVGVLLDSASNLEYCYSAGYANLKEDFCGYSPNNATSSNSQKNYYLSQTELHYEDRENKDNSYSAVCATVVSYEQLAALTEQDSSADTTYDPVPSGVWGTANILSTHPYDIVLGNNAYPFTMLKSGQTASGQVEYMDYYGNWPRKPLDAGIAYYEVYDTNNDGTADELGYYFDRDETSTLLPDKDHSTFTVLSDGYMILSGNETDSVKIGSSVTDLQNGISVGNQENPSVIIGQKVYYVFPLTSNIMDAESNDTFYKQLNVSITTRTTTNTGGTTTTNTVYTFFYNPNVAMSHVNPADGSTTATDPGQAPSTLYIRTARQLAAVGKNMSNFWDKDYIQQLDIDFTKYKDGDKLNPAPIGNGTTAFTGSYIGRKDNGQIPKIIGYKPANAENSGIFGVIDKKGVVRNLSLVADSKTNQQFSGGGSNTTNIGLLAGENKGTVENVDLELRNSITLTATQNAGLLMGVNSGKLTGCDITQKAGTANLNAAYAGGLAGQVSKDADIENCTIKLNKLAGNGTLAGVFGKVDADVTISDLHFLFDGTDASITSTGNAAGFVGTSAGTIMDCSVRGKGTIKGTTSAAGFAVTVSGGSIDGCVVSPALTDTKEAYDVTSNGDLKITGASAAGFVIENSASIRSCTALGTVTGTTHAAGFVVTNSGTIEYCMSNVDMSSGTVFAKTNSGTVKECYGWASENATLDSTASDSKNYLGSYFGTRAQEESLVLFDFDGVPSTISTFTLAQPMTLNKLTGGSGRSVWVSGTSCDAYSYDAGLTNYPYPMLREHYGDWPEISGNYPYGVVYYEKYSDDFGVELINMNPEYTTALPKFKGLKDNATTEVQDAGYALFCRIDTTPFCDKTNAMIGDKLNETRLYEAAGLNTAEFGLYRLNAEGATDLTVQVQNLNRTVTVDLVPLFANTLNKTREPYSVRTQEHLENIKHLPDGEFVIDRCFSVNQQFTSIPTFSGKLTGIEGAMITAENIASGLFDQATKATFDHVNLDAIITTVVSGSDLVLGTLVNTATDCTITDCTVKTAITVTEPSAPNTQSDEAEPQAEDSSAATPKNSITIGGIVGKMLGGEMIGGVTDGQPNMTVSGSISTNSNTITDHFSCTIGGAVGIAGSSDSEDFGIYENVSSSVTIAIAWGLSEDDQNIGEFVGFVYGGGFTNCASYDATFTRHFLGGVMPKPETVKGATHIAEAPNGAITDRNTDADTISNIYPNTTLVNCLCYDTDSANNTVVYSQDIKEDKYFFTHFYIRADDPVNVTLEPAFFTADKMSSLVGKTGYFYRHTDEIYYPVEITSIDNTDGATGYTFSFTDVYGKTETIVWTDIEENSTFDQLYTITTSIDLSQGNQYMIITPDENYALEHTDTVLSVPNNTMGSSNKSLFWIANGSALVSSANETVTVYAYHSNGSEFVLMHNNSPFSLSIKNGDQINTYTQFSLYEVTTKYEKVATSYKVTFDTVTPTT